MNKLTAYDFDLELQRLSNSDNLKFSENECSVVQELIKAMLEIVPDDEYNHKEMYFSVDRGEFENTSIYSKIQVNPELYSDEDIKNLKDTWLAKYPEDKVWYFLDTKSLDLFAGIRINDSIVFNQHLLDNSKFDRNSSDFFQTIKAGVEESIKLQRKGIYSKTVMESLPYSMRTADIPLSDYFEIYPEEKVRFYKDLTEKQINEFVNLVDEHLYDDADYHVVNKPYIEPITPAKFLEICNLCYRAANYPKNSEESIEQEFLRLSGHSTPPENPTVDINTLNKYDVPIVAKGDDKITLSINHDDEGWFFDLNTDSINLTADYVKMFMSLVKKGEPVSSLYDTFIRDALMQDSLVGIVPEYIKSPQLFDFPYHVNIWAIMNFPEHKREELIEKADWYGIPEVELHSTKEVRRHRNNTLNR